jgi:radical SAM protein with 4Fe4S-binding SPASM domain
LEKKTADATLLSKHDCYADSPNTESAGPWGDLFSLGSGAPFETGISPGFSRGLMKSMTTICPNLTVQWHITNRCRNKCKHCYMSESISGKDESGNALDLEGMIRVLDSFAAFEKKWAATIGHFNISGGDPLLHDDWEAFLLELKRRGKDFSLMGNPETLTEKAVAFMAQIGLKSFQMSLDGLEKTHDQFRSQGSFRSTVDKLELLDRHGIFSNIMFTLFPANAEELVPLLRYVAENTRAAAFDFDMGCFVGNAAGIDRGFSAGEIRHLFGAYIDEKKRLQEAGNSIHIGEKSNLLKLTRFEKNEFYPVRADGLTSISGCLAGWAGVVVLADGSVLACRRLPQKVGKIPEQSFEEIFLGSELLQKFRRPEYFSTCGTCDFYQYCRGCPAMVYSLTNGDPFAENPLCFRHIVHRQTKEGGRKAIGPPLHTDHREEFELVAGRVSTTFPARFERLIKDKYLRRIFINLTYSLSERRRFLANPHRYLKDSDQVIKEEGLVFLMHYFSNHPENEIAPGSSGDRLGMAALELMLRPKEKEDKTDLQELIGRAWGNKSFKKALLRDPKSIIESVYGIRLPENVTIRVHEQTPTCFHLSLPATPTEFDEKT